jgi:hypothetical protein
MDYSKEEIDRCLEEGSKNQKKFSKMKKSASYLSMENLDIEEESAGEENEEESGEEEGSANGSGKGGDGEKKVDFEKQKVEPTYVLDKAFKRMTAVGSSTALVAIRNKKNI